MLQAEWQRIVEGRPTEELDLSGYQPREPDDPASEAEWQRALDQLRMNLEHQRTRLLNLELMGRYGKASWERAADAADSQRRWVARSQRLIQEEVCLFVWGFRASLFYCPLIVLLPPASFCI